MFENATLLTIAFRRLHLLTNMQIIRIVKEALRFVFLYHWNEAAPYLLDTNYCLLKSSIEELVIFYFVFFTASPKESKR